MTIHKSLVLRNKLIRHRNVLSRAERIKKLAAEEKWKDGDSVFGLPKVKHVVYKRIKAKKEKTAEVVAAEAAATTETAAATEAGATPTKGEAPKTKAEPAKDKEAKKK